MDIQQPLQLLGGLTPQQFMKRHWQKKPLLVRQAIPSFKPLLERPACSIWLPARRSSRAC
jgi:50S ribosomal protein L16 3-hydroxylase